MKIGQHIKQIRMMRGYTQQQLAEKSGIAQYNISRIENGGGKITINTLTKLLSSLNAKLVIEINTKKAEEDDSWI